MNMGTKKVAREVDEEDPVVKKAKRSQSNSEMLGLMHEGNVSLSETAKAELKKFEVEARRRQAEIDIKREEIEMRKYEAENTRMMLEAAPKAQEVAAKQNQVISVGQGASLFMYRISVSL